MAQVTPIPSLDGILLGEFTSESQFRKLFALRHGFPRGRCHPRGRGLRHGYPGVTNPMSVSRWQPSSGAAGGTVRWGLRAGQIAWPDRSAPASAVGKLAFNNGVGNSLSGVGSFDVAVLPRLRRLGHSDRILLGLLHRMDGFEMGGIAALLGRRARSGRAALSNGTGIETGPSSSWTWDTSPRIAGRTRAASGEVPDPVRIGGDSVTHTARGRSSIASGRAPRRLGRAPRASMTRISILHQSCKLACGGGGDDGSTLYQLV